MGWKNYLRQFLRDVRSQKLRAALTLFGLVWGTAAVTLLLAFGEGLQERMIKNIRGLGENIVIIWMGELAVFFVIVHLVLGAAALGRNAVLAVLLLILLAGANELTRAWRRIGPPRPAQVWLVFPLASAAALWNTARLPPAAFAFLFLAAAAGDGFAQVVGQWVGRRPLAPTVSPTKTVEGFLAGLCAAGSVAALASGLIDVTPSKAVLIGVLTGATGLVGDLSASWVKRRAGIKDYSSALPGQGGFLDRFDSLLGLLCVLTVLAGERPDTVPADPWITRWEGWVLGQTALPVGNG
jgi:phosphatidate cytidylyltransferase